MESFMECFKKEPILLCSLSIELFLMCEFSDTSKLSYCSVGVA